MWKKPGRYTRVRSPQAEAGAATSGDASVGHLNQTPGRTSPPVHPLLDTPCGRTSRHGHAVGRYSSLELPLSTRCPPPPLPPPPPTSLKLPVTCKARSPPTRNLPTETYGCCAISRGMSHATMAARCSVTTPRTRASTSPCHHRPLHRAAHCPGRVSATGGGAASAAAAAAAATPTTTAIPNAAASHNRRRRVMRPAAGRGRARGRCLGRGATARCHRSWRHQQLGRQGGAYHGGLAAKGDGAWGGTGDVTGHADVGRGPCKRKQGLWGMCCSLFTSLLSCWHRAASLCGRAVRRGEGARAPLAPSRPGQAARAGGQGGSASRLRDWRTLQGGGARRARGVSWGDGWPPAHHVHR